MSCDYKLIIAHPFTTCLVDLDICKSKPICISSFKVYFTVDNSGVRVKLPSIFDIAENFAASVAFG